MDIPQPADRDAYFQLVWAIVREIPPGQVATYGQIASLIPCPEGSDPAEWKAFGPRWVGSAMAASPEGVPWQRVINSQGKVSLRRSGATSQRALLEAEGVPFDERERVDLKRYGWTGPSEAFRREHGLDAPPGEARQMGLF